MSKQKGLIRLQGKLGGISFYKSDGEDLARLANGPSKERIDTDAAFVRTRENNTEFGGSATGAKALRLSLISVVDTMSDKRLVSRLTALFKEINLRGTGTRGQRTISVSANRVLITNLEFNKNLSFGSVFNAPFTFTNSAARNQGTITIPAFTPQSFINAPAGATHFQLITALGVVSDYAYNTSTQRYDPTDPTLNTLSVSAVGAITSLTSATPVNFSLVANLPGTPTMTATTSVAQCLGIQFYQQVGANYYLFAQGNCMKVVNTF
jgi:hypothetical protein